MSLESRESANDMAPFTTHYSHESLPLTFSYTLYLMHKTFVLCSHFCFEPEPMREGIFVVEWHTSIIQVLHLTIVLVSSTWTSKTRQHFTLPLPHMAREPACHGQWEDPLPKTK